MIRSVALEILNDLRTLHNSQQIRIRLELEPKTYTKTDLPEPAERCMLAKVRKFEQSTAKQVLGTPCQYQQGNIRLPWHHINLDVVDENHSSKACVANNQLQVPAWHASMDFVFLNSKLWVDNQPRSSSLSFAGEILVYIHTRSRRQA